MPDPERPRDGDERENVPPEPEADAVFGGEDSVAESLDSTREDIVSGAAGRDADLLRELVEGDPLEITVRAERRMQERAYLLDSDSLSARAAAHIAVRAADYDGRTPFEEWVERCVDEAIAAQLDADREDPSYVSLDERTLEPRHAFLAAVLGLEPRLTGRACLVLNDLPEGPRRAVFDLVVMQKPFNRFISEGHGPPDRARELLRRGLRALSMLDVRWADEDEGVDGA